MDRSVILMASPPRLLSLARIFESSHSDSEMAATDAYARTQPKLAEAPAALSMTSPVTLMAK